MASPPLSLFMERMAPWPNRPNISAILRRSNILPIMGSLLKNPTIAFLLIAMNTAAIIAIIPVTLPEEIKAFIISCGPAAPAN